MNLHFPILHVFDSSSEVLFRPSYPRNLFREIRFHSFLTVSRIRAPSLRTVSFECCRTRVAHKSRDGPPGSVVYPVTFSTSHRTRRFESPSSRGRHRSCQVLPSSMRIPRRYGAPVRSRGKSEMRPFSGQYPRPAAGYSHAG